MSAGRETDIEIETDLVERLVRVERVENLVDVELVEQDERRDLGRRLLRIILESLLDRQTLEQLASCDRPTRHTQSQLPHQFAHALRMSTLN